MKSKNEDKNNAGDSIVARNSSWSFGGDVAKHFDEHVNKSVPFYEEGHDLISKVSDFYLSDNSTCYELGCSTATLSKKIAERHINKNIKIIGIDKEKNMVIEAKMNCKGFRNIKVVNNDLLEFEYKKSDLIISYYTIQFVSPKNRQTLINRIYESLNWGGAFLLFEKVRAPDARFQDILTALYTEYKLDKGYTPSEIISKHRSLKGVLEPFSSQGNTDLMIRAGFVDIMSIYKYMCFEGYLAIK